MLLVDLADSAALTMSTRLGLGLHLQAVCPDNVWLEFSWVIPFFVLFSTGTFLVMFSFSVETGAVTLVLLCSMLLTVSIDVFSADTFSVVMSFSVETVDRFPTLSIFSLLVTFRSQCPSFSIECNSHFSLLSSEILSMHFSDVSCLFRLLCKYQCNFHRKSVSTCAAM